MKPDCRNAYETSLQDGLAGLPMKPACRNGLWSRFLAGGCCGRQKVGMKKAYRKTLVELKRAVAMAGCVSAVVIAFFRADFGFGFT